MLFKLQCESRNKQESLFRCTSSNTIFSLLYFREHLHNHTPGRCLLMTDTSPETCSKLLSQCFTSSVVASLSHFSLYSDVSHALEFPF